MLITIISGITPAIASVVTHEAMEYGDIKPKKSKKKKRGGGYKKYKSRSHQTGHRTCKQIRRHARRGGSLTH